ncbi:amino acid adenylation domain-containing protein [Streptomyces sp. C10-9-1]|uniref:non-ribosomal peptide synthetase n=1 Tax=Streptomyces sp. C10-9-1 TaxID=1859285 RepID=UPI00211366A4|nr:non-ribosomal peptide synthetase [Streptomyces sp. C10-9-1]MCQ6552226.1 amino acid adenylation domain-containing protein [Streptomyces sp. C10-9-1]
MNQDKTAADTILRIVSEVLPEGADPSPDTPLRAYSLGSLAAVRLLAEIRAALGATVSLEALRGGTTVRQLAELVTGSAAGQPPADGRGGGSAADGAGAPGAATAEGTEAGDAAAPFPLTPVQQAYLVGRDPGLVPDPAGCRLYREFTVPGLDAARMADAWRSVVAHHEALRLAPAGAAGQRVLPADDPGAVPDVPRHDLRDAGRAEFALHLVRVRERLTCGELTDDAPPHAVELSLGPDGGVVHLLIDGAVTDGHGLAVVLRHWWERYEDPEHPLPTPAMPLRDAVLALRRRQGTPAHEEDLAYWRERLSGLPPAPDAARVPQPVAPPGGHPRRALDDTLTPDQWQALKRRAAALEISPSALVLTVFTEAAGRHGSAGPSTVVLTTADRARLPRSAQDLPGPFTSTVVFPVTPAFDRPFDEAAREVHDRLWRDLEHGGVSGVEALRALRAPAGGGSAPVLPVVFTSLLDTAHEAPGGFGRAVSHTVARTSGVALDHQMWEADGGLRCHWDVTDALLAPGAAERLFAEFGNRLRELAAGEPAAEETRTLNQLQQAYFVARVQDTRPGNGCQVYHAFQVAGLGAERLAERAADRWHAMTERYDVLRSSLHPDGTLRVRPQAGPRRRVPVLRPPAEDRAGWFEELRHRLAGTAFPPGRWPAAELLVTPDGPDAATVHVVLDLALADGRSLHLLIRELMRGCATEEAWHPALPAGVPTPEPPSEAAREAARAHWRDRLRGLPPGPVLRTGTERRRTRRSGTLTGWRAIHEALTRRGLSPDAVLVAALTEALATGLPDDDFSVAAVRWRPGDEARRPGEHTGLSWIPHGPRTRTPAERAASCHRLLEADTRHGDAVDGLAELRRQVLRRRGGDAHAYGFPVVHTGLLELTEHPAPPSVRGGTWLTYTPDVSLDSICVAEGDTLHFHWDAVDADFPTGVLDTVFAAYRERLNALPPAGSVTPEGDGATVAAPGSAERELVLHGWNATATALPDERPVHRFFEDWAARTPDATALRHTGGSLSYRALNRRANAVARLLRSAGVGPGSPVGVRYRRGPGMVAAVLGVLKAGGAYVPLEHSQPAARAAAMLSDAGAEVLLTDEAGADPGGPGGGVRVLVTAAGEAADADADPELDSDPDPGTGPHDLAYVIFTSGSTGRPKGVAVTHRPVRNLLNWAWRTFRFGPGDTGLMVTSLGFDLSVFDLFGLLGSGACVRVADESEQRDPALLLDVLLREPVTFWNSAPTTLAQLLPLLPGPAAGHPGTGDLRLVFLSGDYTPLNLPGELRAVFRRADLISLGGATEATVWSNWFRVLEVDPAWRSIPYGRPVDNARYYVLDAERRPCRIGVAGELYIGGDCLAREYRGRPELTAERFVPDPYAGTADARMYRTGDRAVFGPDGVIEFLGRADDQVKIRGFRVEPGEVEHRLRSHPAVRDVKVLARPDPSGDRTLVAYVLPDGDAPTARELRAYAAEALPDYLVPSHVRCLDAFPATANGKLDREALPWPPEDACAQEGPAEPDTAEAPDAADGPDPRTGGDDRAAALAQEIARSAAELIGIPEIAPDADLWDAGATSFTMVRVSQALHLRHGVRIPVSTLLEAPTAAGIARSLAALLADAPAAADGEPTREAGEGREAPREPAPERTAGHRPGRVDPLSAAERDAFKAARWNLRAPDPAEAEVALPPAEVPVEHYTARTSRRTYAAGPLPADALSALLAPLRERHVGGRARRTYPSAGDTYAVQVYLHLKPDAVTSLPGGVYYYDPERHALRLVNPAPDIDRTVHFVTNRPVFDGAGFELYLVGQTHGIEPLYASDAERYLLVEAGYLGQSLMAGQERSGVGLCPVGQVAFDRVRSALRLDPGHRYLHAFLGGGLTVPASRRASADAPAAAAVHAPAPPAAADSGRPYETAVVGLSGRYPDAPDPESLWHRLRGGHRAVRPAPAGRLHQTGGTPGGYLDLDAGPQAPVAEALDPARGLGPRQAEWLDPQLRLLMHLVGDCLHDAGHTPGSLRRAAPRTGVFVAAMWPDHQLNGADHWARTGQAEFSGIASDLPNRLSHALGLRGPSLAVNTSCSSSLTALHLARESLRRGECEAALVAAVNLVAHPYHTALLGGLGLTAPDGVSGAYDAVVSGWSPGEGGGALLLRPADAARADDAPLHGVIESTWLGFAAGDRFGAPDVAALSESLALAVRQAAVEPGDIGYAECAATGAALSDAAELQALREVFGDRDGGRLLPVGTLKPAIGHLESAAGLAQLTKVLLQMRHGTLAPTLLAERRSPLVDWDRLPLRVVSRAEPWRPRDPGVPLRALVNAVGATGSLAHAVLRAPAAGERPFPAPAGDARAVPAPAPPASPPSALPVTAAAPAAVTVAAPGAGDGADGPAAAVEQRLTELYAEVTGVPRAELDPATPLERHGLTSFVVARLTARLREEFATVPATLFFEHRDLASAARALAAASGPRSLPSASPTAAERPPAPRPEGIAVIGLAGRYPGAADLDAFWDVLSRGRDQIRALPASRRRGRPGEDLMWGGFLDGHDLFDPQLFGIAPRTADLMDPQERLFLEVLWEALEDAGYPRDRLHRVHGHALGVYVGAMHNEYPYLGVESTLAGSPRATGATPGGIANRASWFLDAQGPSLTVDTMCSASLTALHLAVRDLREGLCEVAVAGGVSLSLHPNKYVQQRDMGMTSHDHRCRGFGADGDGFIPGEGVGAVLLKPLDRALADGDRVHGVIRGTAIGHGGRTNGYTVPEPAAQARVVGAALRAAGLAPGAIGYVEAHGTGTALGDPVEIAGLHAAYGALPPGSVPVGTVKSLIGHLEAAAGIAGLTKVLLQFRHGRLAPTLHAERPNPEIDWAAVPFRLQREPADWPRPEGGARLAGLSSFGAGGSNAHLVVEEPPAAASEQGDGTGPAAAAGAGEGRVTELVVLSARTADALTALAGRLAAALTESADGRRPPALRDIAHTLRIGREELPERAAFLVATADELRVRLRDFDADGTDRPAGVLRGRAAAAPRAGERRDPRGSELAEIARTWVRGTGWDWALLPGATAAALVPLPSYPFARRRCWPPEQPPAAAAAGATRDAAPAPPPVPVPLYTRTWRDHGPVGGAGTPAPETGGGRVLVLATEATWALARETVRALRPLGAEVLVESGHGSAGGLGAGVRRFHDEATLLDAAGDLTTCRGVIDLADLWRPEEAPGPWRARTALMQRLPRAARDGGTRRLRLMLVTSGLQEPSGTRPSWAGAHLAGVLRVLHAEHPTLVDATRLDTDLPSAEQIAGEWRLPEAPAEVCHRNGRRLVPDTVPLPGGVPGAGSFTADPEAAYLVTGGTGALGALAARFLVERGARRIALTGLRALPDRARWDDPGLPAGTARAVEAVRELERRGATVLTHAGPLSDRPRLTAFLDRVRSRLGPPAGVIHCAGTGSRGPAPFAEKALEDIAAVLEPKTGGLRALAELTAQDRPSFFVVFSSVSSALPRLAAGVGDYAVANGCADAYARYRRRLGDAGFRSVQWPVWRDGPAPAEAVGAAARAGLGTLATDDGLAVLERLLEPGGAPVVLVAPPGGDTGADLGADAAGGSDREGGAGVPPGDVPPGDVTPVAVAPGPVPGAEGPEVPGWLAGLLEDVAGIPAGELDPERSFTELGVESVMLAELVTRIEAHTGRPLQPAVLLDHPTPRALARHLAPAGGVPPEPVEDRGPDPAESGGPGETPVPPAPPRPVPTVPPRPGTAPDGPALAPEAASAGHSAQIAVIGMACRFPGAADPDGFWELLTAGRHAIREVPPDRWDTAAHYRPGGTAAGGGSVSRWGGFLDGLEEFDPGFFGMTDEAARTTDPAVRLFLEGSAAALRSAGYRDEEVAGRAVGVFAGARMSGYRHRAGPPGSVAGLGGDQNFIAAMPAHHFDLRGPALVVDSACSSALLAVQSACRSLLAGESEMALAGGVEVLLDEEPYLEFSAARALSPTGRCRTFDERADGFVPGEGCGVLLLKPLHAALRDGDRITAVIDAVAANNDGRTMGLTTPSPASQAALVNAALAAAGARPEQIGMIEAHGTATLIGDPIELRALQEVFAGRAPDAGPLPVGSVKSNIGHLFSAAGIAGLIKAALAVERGLIPPTVGCERPNPRFDFENSPLRVQRQSTPWPEAARRLAGVSAFGLGGTNAHAVLGGLTAASRARYRPLRAPLPAPRFHRRRCWLDRPPQPGGRPPVTSLLRLTFADPGPDRPSPALPAGKEHA